MILKTEIPFENLRVVQRSDYKWGVLDADGNEIVPFGKYSWISGFERGGYARVKSTNDNGSITIHENRHPFNFAKWGIIDTKGNEVVPLEYDEIWGLYEGCYRMVMYKMTDEEQAERQKPGFLSKLPAIGGGIKPGSVFFDITDGKIYDKPSTHSDRNHRYNHNDYSGNLPNQ